MEVSPRAVGTGSQTIYRSIVGQYAGQLVVNMQSIVNPDAVKRPDRYTVKHTVNIWSRSVHSQVHSRYMVKIGTRSSTQSVYGQDRYSTHPSAGVRLALSVKDPFGRGDVEPMGASCSLNSQQLVIVQSVVQWYSQWYSQ